VDPCVGERDRRSEDRQLLLDAVMSASEQLIVLYSGADPVTGAVRPPAVPLGELLDVVALTCGEDITKRHPLQPFAPRNVDAAAPFSFDPAALRGARAAVSGSRADLLLLERPLPALEPVDIDLDDLIAFAQHPIQAFLRQRLGIRVPDPEDDDDVLDHLDTQLKGLATWDIGERMLVARLRGVEASAFRDAEWRRGTLPPFRLGSSVLAEVEPTVELLTQACRPLHSGPARILDIDLPVGSSTVSRRLTGTITGIHGDVLVTSSYSSLSAKHRMAAWIRLLAVAATSPDRDWEAITTGRGAFRRPTARSTLSPPPDPLAVLRSLVDVRDRGLREPLPAGPKASVEYASRRLRGDSVGDALEAASTRWSGSYGDAADRHVTYVHGPGSTVRGLLREPPADEGAWYPEPSRFGAVARRLWTPLLEREQVGPA
jgi:exodeoxyribonuclease V gamma subunit